MNDWMNLWYRYCVTLAQTGGEPMVLGSLTGSMDDLTMNPVDLNLCEPPTGPIEMMDYMKELVG